MKAGASEHDSAACLSCVCETGNREHTAAFHRELYSLCFSRRRVGVGGQAFTRCPWALNTSVRVWRLPGNLANIWLAEMKTCGQTNSARSLSSCCSWRSADRSAPAVISCTSEERTLSLETYFLFSSLFVWFPITSNGRVSVLRLCSTCSCQMPASLLDPPPPPQELFGSSFVVSVLSDIQS